MYHSGRVSIDPKAATEPKVAADSGAARSSAAPFRAFIEGELAKRRNGAAIYQDSSSIIALKVRMMPSSGSCGSID